MVKLMKYEFRPALRLFIPVWIGALLISLLNGLTLGYGLDLPEHWVFDMLRTLMIVVNVFAMIAILLLPTIYIFMRFYQSTMKDEGYLTFTLPMKIDSILWSKAIVGMVLTVVSVLVGVGSILLLLWSELAEIPIREAMDLLLAYEAAEDLVILAAVYVVLLLVGSLSGIFHMYAAMGLGQMSDKHKVGLSILSYVGINMLVSTLTGTLTTSVIYGLMDNWDSWMLVEQLGELQIGTIALLALLVLQLILGTVFYFAARHLFQKKLNLG